MTLELFATPFLYENKLASTRRGMDEEATLDLIVEIERDISKAKAQLEAFTGVVTDLQDLHRRAHALWNEIEANSEDGSLAELDPAELEDTDSDIESDDDDFVAEVLATEELDEDYWGAVDKRVDGDPAELDFSAD